MSKFFKKGKWQIMRIGVLKEIKENEFRVGIVPSGVDALVKHGHEVYIEKDAGVGSGISDEEYKSAGAIILNTAREVYKMAEMVIKVKEPLESEYELFQKGQIIFTYLHLAADRPLTEALKKSGVTGVAYETVFDKKGQLPLLKPMSEVAGRMSVQLGARFLEKHSGGNGILLGGVPGVKNAKVVVIGAGIVGTNAAKIAVGMGADVTVIDISPDKLIDIDNMFNSRVKTVISNPMNIKLELQDTDLLVSSVLIPGAKAPHIVTEDMVKGMKKGSVIIDVAIDQGGSVETIDRVTTHENPVYEKYGVFHYSVANIPGCVARTSTFALTNSTLPYAIKLADKGMDALKEDEGFAKGVNIYDGKITNKSVADALGEEYSPFV